MRIVVNDIAASKTGALSILMDFYEYVKEYGKDHEWIFLTGGDYLKPCDHIEIRVLSEVKKSQKNRLKFDLINGTSYIESLLPDVVFSLQNTLTHGKIKRPDGGIVPQVLYVHQPLGFQKMKRFSFLKKEEREYAIYQYLIGALIDASVKRADRVIVQTEWMKAAVVDKTKIKADKITNILPDLPDFGEYKKNGLFDCKKFFFPSGEILYKNHECVLKAVELLGKRGYKDYEVFFTLKGLNDVTNRHYEDPYHNVIWNGRISREEVFSHYNSATLVFPSYIETFGVPLAEARQMNSLILASDCPFCHEVLEGYENAYYFNPFQEKELADLMEQVMTGKIVKQETDSITTEDAAQKENSYGRIVNLILQTGKGK